MNSALVSDTVKSAKTLARQVAKQVVQEPGEILGGAGRQVTGAEQPGKPNEVPQSAYAEQPQTTDQTQLHAQDKATGARRIEALDTELREIERQRIINDIQRRIQEGQEVPLIDITQLSHEQKEVLKAQMEAIKVQKNQIQTPGTVQMPASKPSRRLFSRKGPKTQVQREQTKTERPLPPSG